MKIHKKETTCATGFACESYLWYSTGLYSQAVDTYVYNAHGQIVSHTFAGLAQSQSSGEDLANVAEVKDEVGWNQFQTGAVTSLAAVVSIAFGVAAIHRMWNVDGRTDGRSPLLEAA